MATMLFISWILQISKDKGNANHSVWHTDNPSPSSYSAGIIPDAQDYLLSQQRHEDTYKKEYEEKDGDFPIAGVQTLYNLLFLEGYKWLEFRMRLFRTKTHIYLERKQWHSGKGICCINLILILQSSQRSKRLSHNSLQRNCILSFMSE